MPSTALSAILAVAIVLSAIWSVVIWLSSMCCVRIALFAISAATIVPFTIFAEVTELSAIAEAVPVKLPVTLPSIFATRVPVVIVKLPVEAPVNVPVPTVNLSVLSSHPINALFESPLSKTIPISFAGVPVVPVPNSINLSAIVVFVDEVVVVDPVTVKFPPTTRFPDVVRDESVPKLVILGCAAVVIVIAVSTTKSIVPSLSW